MKLNSLGWHRPRTASQRDYLILSRSHTWSRVIILLKKDRHISMIIPKLKKSRNRNIFYRDENHQIERLRKFLLRSLREKLTNSLLVVDQQFLA